MLAILGSIRPPLVLRRKYSAMVLINGLALGLSKSILKTPHRQINIDLIFTTGGLYMVLHSSTTPFFPPFLSLFMDNWFNRACFSDADLCHIKSTRRCNRHWMMTETIALNPLQIRDIQSCFGKYWHALYLLNLLWRLQCVECLSKDKMIHLGK